MMNELSEQTIFPDPIRQFAAWYNEAIQVDPKLPNAMTLATSTREGRPSVRVVLLKEFDERGFVFYTNYKSRKGREIEDNPRVALLFYWPTLDRQVRIEGTVERVSPGESDEYFSSRPRESQISAAISPQSDVIDSREELVSAAQAASDALGGGTVPRPKHWGGYRVKPLLLEFWQNREARLHDRIRYILQSDGIWTTERLAP